MNRMKEIADMFGVELGEVFLLAGTRYKLDETRGLILVSEDKDARYTLANMLLGIVTVEKLPWEPKMGEYFHYPSVGGGVGYERWTGNRLHTRIQNNVGVYRTHKDAMFAGINLGWEMKG